MIFNEGMNRGDLARIIKPVLHIDEYKSKMGDDDDIVVMSIKVIGKEAASDVVNFFERGYDFVLDADVSPGEIKSGEYLVFVEISRRTTAPEYIFKLITELNNLTEQETDDWIFMYAKDENEYKLTLEELSDIIPISPKEYRDDVEKDGDLELDDYADQLSTMTQAAGIPSGKTAVVDDFTESLRVAAGLK